MRLYSSSASGPELSTELHNIQRKCSCCPRSLPLSLCALFSAPAPPSTPPASPSERKPLASPAVLPLLPLLHLLPRLLLLPRLPLLPLLPLLTQLPLLPLLPLLQLLPLPQLLPLLARWRCCCSLNKPPQNNNNISICNRLTHSCYNNMKKL